MKEPVQSLDYGTRWIRDGLHEAVQAGAFAVIDVDVTEATRILRRLKSIDRDITWTHIFVRAVSLTLARNPELHQLVAGNKTIKPESVDICLSVAADSSVTPVVVIEDAASKDIFSIAAEVVRRAPGVVKEHEQLLGVLRRWGWIVPLSVLRRSLIGFAMRRIWYRRKISGTFQISSVPQVDVFAPMLFNTAAVLGVGRVRDRVIAENGFPVVRPVVSLTCCLDHSVWNGKAAATFLSELRQVLESGDFAPASILTEQKPWAPTATAA